MKILFAIYVFFWFVFVSGMKENTLKGSWECVGWDEESCINKFVFFNANGTGNWGVAYPDRIEIDPKKRYTVSPQGDNIYKICRFNESGFTDDFNAFTIEETLFVESKMWLQRSNPNGVLEGFWECVGWDAKRNINKFVVFNEDGTGNWAITYPDRMEIDPTKRYTVFLQGGNKYKIYWINELGTVGHFNAFMEGDALFVENKKWLKRSSSNGSLEGSWKCVGWDAKRNINKFVFFNEDGTGYWAVETPDRAKIDPNKRYTVFSEDLTHYKIYWSNEICNSGHIYADLDKDALFVGKKKWLERLSNEYQLAEIKVPQEPLQREEEKEIILENQNMNWFHDLDQHKKDYVLKYFSQSIQYYGKFTEGVVKDMQEYFEYNTSQIQQLYDFLGL